MIEGFKDIDHVMNLENQAALNSVINALNWSEEYGLQAQVIYYALMFLKTNPTASIQDAIKFGIDEWLK
jgi:hypothetical protein